MLGVTLAMVFVRRNQGRAFPIQCTPLHNHGTLLVAMMTVVLLDGLNPIFHFQSIEFAVMSREGKPLILDLIPP